jgi:diguanylate cyclase (GGDEF)-like protein
VLIRGNKEAARSHPARRRLRIGFKTRLAFALTLTLTLVSGLGYEAMAHLLRDRVIRQEAEYQQAQADAMEAVTQGASKGHAIREVKRLIDAAAQRHGTVETLLIDRDYKVVDAHDDRIVGTRNVDPRITDALEDGIAYAGREADPRRDGRNFEFVTPVNLSGRRYAFEATYDQAFVRHEQNKIRRTIMLIALLGLVVGFGAFYLLGGRSLMRIHHLALERATRDGLTDLGNQRAFRDDLEHAVALASRHGEWLALAVLDLDDFKFHNDRHGHTHGDDLLLRAADVLRNGRVSDRPFRVGGDEFAVLLPRTDAGGAALAMRRLQRAFADAQVQVSVGLSTLRPGEEASTLRDEADAALYEAKRRGGGAIVSFDDIRDDVSVTTPAKVEAVFELLAEGDLSVAFQPIWDLESGSLLGVEALARPADRYGFAGPAEAFDIAEQIGRVHELDKLCVTRILDRADEIPGDTLLFMNVAPRTLDLDSEGEGWLVSAIDGAGIPSDRVVIEVTERYGARMASVVKSLQRLREAGLRLALDDVGAGNSGLEMLRSVDVEFVKIDRSVVVGAMTEPGARGVLLAMATFANETGSIVIAEGIEDDDMLSFVWGLEDDLAASRARIQGGQGYGLGRPNITMPPTANDMVLASMHTHPRATAPTPR